MDISQGVFIIETHGTDFVPMAVTAEYGSDGTHTGAIDSASRVADVISRFADVNKALASMVARDAADG